jgi:hypothetical protein
MTRDEIISALRAAQARASRLVIVRRVLDEHGNEIARFVRENHTGASREARVNHYDD